MSQSSYRVKVTVRFHLISLTLVQLRFQKDGLRFQSWVHPLFTVAFIDPASNVVRRQHSKRAHSSIQSGPRERAVRVVDLAAEVSEKAAWDEWRHVLIGHAHSDDARGSSKSDRYFHLAYDLGLPADPSGLRFILMDPAVGFVVLLLEVGPESLKLLESDQGDLSPRVNKSCTWFYVEPNELLCRVVGKA